MGLVNSRGSKLNTRRQSLEKRAASPLFSANVQAEHNNIPFQVIPTTPWGSGRENTKN